MKYAVWFVRLVYAAWMIPAGLNHFIEAVQQLRPQGVVDDLCNGAHTYDRTICRQVRNPQIALLCGECVDSAMLLRKA